MSSATKLVLLSATLAVAGGLIFFLWRSPARVPVRAPAASATTPASATPPGTLRDPLAPERLVRIDESRALAADWVSARPGFQASRSAAERGGVEPCATQAFDTSGFEEWQPLSRGHFTLPRDFKLDAEGGFDLVMHFNGESPVLRELVESGQRFVLYTFTLPPTDSYAAVFASRLLFPALVNEIEQKVSQRAGKPAHHRRLALSAWSAGFTGVRTLLAQPAGESADAVLLIDGLHAPRGDRQAFEAQLEPFLSYATRAAAGERLFLVSHSSIDPPDFASTTECAHYLIHRLGGEPQPVRRDDPLGLELVEYFTRAQFHVRGYSGNDKADHCAELAVLRGAFVALGKRWAESGATAR
ncbi:MAG TPA: hypothetical protein VGQ57_21735 [Polyangiaceae bacterium]|nr:hypothetical protein [Polyangiaceae bacterium]